MNLSNRIEQIEKLRNRLCAAKLKAMSDDELTALIAATPSEREAFDFSDLSDAQLERIINGKFYEHPKPTEKTRIKVNRRGSRRNVLRLSEREQS